MITRVVMPRLSLTMKEGTVGKWYKKEGDAIEKNEPIVELVSEKATYDLEAPVSGVLRRILAREGVDVPVSGILAVITDPDEVYLDAELPADVQSRAGETGGRIVASPAAKRLAREYELDLSLVGADQGEGRISEEDVRRYIEKNIRTTLKVKSTIELSGLRKIIAERLSTSFRTAPHSTIVMEVDASKATIKHQKLQVSYTAIVAEAAIRALVEYPIINSSLDGNRIKLFETINVGIAVATDNGLVVPVIHDADKKSLQEINTSIENLTGKAKQEKLTRDDVTDGTFTITNLGMYEVDFFIPIINPPEAAILGIGVLRQKPFVADGKIEIRPSMMLSLSYDHRIVDGAPAAKFLHQIKRRIENATEP